MAKAAKKKPSQAKSAAEVRPTTSVIKKPSGRQLERPGLGLPNPLVDSDPLHPDYDLARKRWPRWVKLRVRIVLASMADGNPHQFPLASATWSVENKAKACKAMRSRLGNDWHAKTNGENWLRTQHELFDGVPLAVS